MLDTPCWRCSVEGKEDGWWMRGDCGLYVGTGWRYVYRVGNCLGWIICENHDKNLAVNLEE
jgi:hypothetical protein